MMTGMETRTTISVYADTSVLGGVFDDEFSGPSKALIDAVRAGRFTLITSELVRQEIEAAPQVVRQLFAEMLPVAEIAAVVAEYSPLEVIEHEDEDL